MSEASALQAARLRSALEHRSGDLDLDAAVRASLGLAVGSDAAMDALYRQETAPRQVLLDLHLTGGGVSGHATSAALLAGFVQRISEATKAVAKQITGNKHYSEKLLIDGVGPGSVRVVLRAPDHAPSPDHLGPVEVESADSKALRRVAGLLALASDDSAPADDSDPLAAAVEDLPLEAQISLRSAARDVIKAGWEIQGVVRQWREPEDRVTVTTRGAQQLRAALTVRVQDRAPRVVVGTLDGFRRWTGVAYIKPDGDGARPLAVAVADPTLFHSVARMAAFEDLPVRATWEEGQSVQPDGSPGRVTRRLTAIESLGEQPALELNA